MTKEELKEHCLKQIEMCEFWAISKGEKPCGKAYEEHKLILELLEQEPCEDCISRQAALDVIEREEFKGDAISEIEKLSPVTPHSKMGRWVKYGIPRCGEQHYQCTSCEYYINFGQWGELYSKEFKYCPNCGAKMEV